MANKKSPSNKDLQNQINGLDGRMSTFEIKLNEVHEWITEYKGFLRGKNQNMQIKFSTSTGDFIIKLVTAVVVAFAGVMLGRTL